MTTLTEALATSTAAEIEAETLDDLATDGADVEGWDDIAPQRLLVVQHARARAAEQTIRADTVAAGWLHRAVDVDDSFVDEHLIDRGVDRIAATKAVHTWLLTCAAGAGPYTIAASSRELVAQADDATLFESTNPAAVTVPAGGSVLCQFTARAGGTAGNQLAGFVTRLVVGKPGLSVSNAADTGSSLDTVARDAETNAAAALRYEGRLGSLSGVLTAAGWRYVLLTPAVGGVETLTRCFVDDANPDGPNSIRIYIGNAAGAATAAELTAAQTQAARFKIAGAGSVTVLSVAEKAVAFTAVLKTDGTNALASAQAVTAVAAYVAALEGNTLYFWGVGEALMSPAGVTTLQSFSLSADVTKAASEVFVVTPTVSQV